jgi:hypothetical protein
MPKLDLTIPADVLSDQAKQELPREMGAALLLAAKAEREKSEAPA